MTSLPVALPWVFLSLSGWLVFSLGTIMMGGAQRAQQGFQGRVSPAQIKSRMIMGNVLGALLTGTMIVFALMLGVATWHVYAVGAIIWLYVGVIVPRRPQAQAKQLGRKLRSLLPSLVNHLRIGLEANDSTVTLLEGYAKRPDQALAPMRDVINDALRMMTTQRRASPFQALLAVSLERECVELQEVARSLADAEETGADLRQSLEGFERLLEQLMRDETQRMINKRQMLLTFFAALGLVVGLLGGILFIAVAGSLL